MLRMQICHTTSAMDRCAVCHHAVPAGRRYRHWASEFLLPEKNEPLSFPVQRLAPHIVTAWDFKIMLVNEGLVPVGMVCSQLCAHFLDNHSFPHRMRRLRLCRRRGCCNINLAWSGKGSEKVQDGEDKTGKEIASSSSSAACQQNEAASRSAKIGATRDRLERKLEEADRDMRLMDETLTRRPDAKGDARLMHDLDNRDAGRESTIREAKEALEEADETQFDKVIGEVKKTVADTDRDLEEVQERLSGEHLVSEEEEEDNEDVEEEEEEEEEETAPSSPLPPPPPPRRRERSPSCSYVSAPTSCRFGCGGSGEGTPPGLVYPNRLYPVTRPTGSLGNCDHCGAQRTMVFECLDCGRRKFCEIGCQLKAMHECSATRVNNYNRVLHFGTRFVGTWAMLGRRSNGDQVDLRHFVRNCHKCRPCFPYTMQLVLSNRPSCRRQYLSSYFPQVIKIIFAIHRLGANDTSASFSTLNLGSALDVLEQMVDDCKNPELMARNNVEEILDCLYEVYSDWMSDHRSLLQQRGGGGGGSAGGSNGSDNFYDYESMLDMDAALKYCHAYAVSLCAHAFMAQVEDEELPTQTERASQLHRFFPMFIDLISCPRESPLLSTNRSRPHLVSPDPLQSVREHALENFGRIFSYCSPRNPSPECITLDLITSVVHGQEQSVHIKVLESRMVITVALVGWFHSKRSHDFADLTREFAAVVASQGASHPRRLYYQPALMGPSESKHELPSTLLQNYLLLAAALAGQQHGPGIIQESRMLDPLADLLCHEPRRPVVRPEGEAALRRRRTTLVRHMQDPQLFHFPVVAMLHKVFAGMDKRLSYSRVKAYLAEDGGFMRIVHCVADSCPVASEELGDLKDGVNSYKSRKLSQLQNKINESEERDGQEMEEEEEEEDEEENQLAEAGAASNEQQ